MWRVGDVQCSQWERGGCKNDPNGYDERRRRLVALLPSELQEAMAPSRCAGVWCGKAMTYLQDHGLDLSVHGHEKGRRPKISRKGSAPEAQ